MNINETVPLLALALVGRVAAQEQEGVFSQSPRLARDGG